MAERLVGRLDDVRAAGSVVVDVDGRSIGVFSVGDALYALRNRCPHQGGPLCTGVVVDAVRARLDERKHIVEYVDETTQVVACPWHGVEFDLKTGVALADPALRVRTYPVEVREGQVYVLMDGAAEEQL
jgi:nitrite reductase/ring-hydroxylating ferredoxin subunit